MSFSHGIVQFEPHIEKISVNGFLTRSHKLGCAATNDGLRLEIWDLELIEINAVLVAKNKGAEQPAQ